MLKKSIQVKLFLGDRQKSKNEKPPEPVSII